jgi:hypothetical protein
VLAVLSSRMTFLRRRSSSPIAIPAPVRIKSLITRLGLFL